jgi:SSS family solute:Na+ symporter
MFAIDHVGWSQIFAWLVAGIGAVFSTQYVVQAIATVPTAAKARLASFYSAMLLIPFGIGCAVIGMCARLLYPQIASLDAFPVLISHMDTWMAAIVVAGLAGSLFGSISAVTIGTATLIYRDFYMPLFDTRGDKANSLIFVRAATIFVGLLPIPLAILSSKVLAVAFLAKSLRASLAVLVLMVFYAPNFGTRRGALISILASLVAVIGWFLAGNPFGIDNAYIAVLVPLLVMAISHLVRMAKARTIVPAR